MTELWKYCREFRPNGPTPCYWPACDCEAYPTRATTAYLATFFQALAVVTFLAVLSWMFR